MTNVRPTIKRRFPMANKALSKNKRIPSPINVIPKRVKPTPICFELLNSNEFMISKALTKNNKSPVQKKIVKKPI